LIAVEQIRTRTLAPAGARATVKLIKSVSSDFREMEAAQRGSITTVPEFRSNQFGSFHRGFGAIGLLVLPSWTAFHPELLCVRREAWREGMTSVATMGLDIAKSVFQVHGVDAAGASLFSLAPHTRARLGVFRKVGAMSRWIDAYSTSHYWARELIARGREVRLMSAQYVKPYVKRGKNNAADAEAICEAVGRTAMRFVPVTTPA